MTKRKKRSSIPSHIFVSRSNAVKKEKKKTKDRRRCNREGGGGEKRVETVSTGVSELGSAEEKCRGEESVEKKKEKKKKVGKKCVSDNRHGCVTVWRKRVERSISRGDDSDRDNCGRDSA